MKVLVTGGCGFLGSHVCEHYAKRGDQVISLDNLTRFELMRTGYDIKAARYHNHDLLKRLGVRLVEASVCDADVMMDVSHDCDYIIHCAAQPAMTIGIEQPDLDISTNVIGTFNVLQAARRHRIPVASCSTIHVYGNSINETITEGDTRFLRNPPAIDESYPVMHGKLTPLHASKMAGELYAQTFIDTYGVEAAIFRLTGMYGPRQLGGEDHGWVANFAIRTILKLPIKIFGTDKQVRDILYVTDAVASFDAFYKSRKSGVYNVGGGTGNIISLGECLKAISEITGIKQDISLEPARLGDLWYFACDITKAKRDMGWEPKVSNREGIANLINWIKDNSGLFGRATK